RDIKRCPSPHFHREQIWKQSCGWLSNFHHVFCPDPCSENRLMSIAESRICEHNLFLLFLPLCQSFRSFLFQNLLCPRWYVLQMIYFWHWWLRKLWFFLDFQPLKSINGRITDISQHFSTAVFSLRKNKQLWGLINKCRAIFAS